jgi:hypothetical protein
MWRCKHYQLFQNMSLPWWHSALYHAIALHLGTASYASGLIKRSAVGTSIVINTTTMYLLFLPVFTTLSALFIAVYVYQQYAAYTSRWIVIFLSATAYSLAQPQFGRLVELG